MGRIVKINQHLRRFFSLARAVDITADRVAKYVRERQQEEAANGSINRELAALKRAFTLATRAGRLRSAPYIPLLEENNSRRGFIDHASFLTLREGLPAHLKDLVTFLYLSGWRVSEMRSLEWRDVDFADHQVRLRPEESNNKHGPVLPLRGELQEIIERARQNRRSFSMNRANRSAISARLGKQLAGMRAFHRSSSMTCGARRYATWSVPGSRSMWRWN